MLKRTVVLYILVLSIHEALCIDLPDVLTDESRLLSQLLETYEPIARPVYSANKSVTVHFGLTLIQIHNLDEKNQILDTNVWLEQTWVDERLHWNPADFNNVTEFRIPGNYIWLPDVVLYNNANDYYLKHAKVNVFVRHTGWVTWAPPMRLKSSCIIDVTYFPFDKQKCALKFGSWMYDQSQVDIINMSSKIDLSMYISNGEWHIIDTFLSKNEVVYPIDHSVYPDVTVHIHIRRKVLYFFINIIVPCLWLNLISLLTFLLPAESGEKITMSITLFLSYSFFLLMVADSIPPTSEQVPVIGLFISLSMAVNYVIIVCTVLVLKVHHGGISRFLPPKLLRRVVLTFMQKACNCSNNDRYGYTNPNSFNIRKCTKHDVILREIQNILDFQISHFSLTGFTKDSSCSTSKDEDGHFPEKISLKENTRTVVLSEIREHLGFLVRMSDEMEQRRHIAREWHELARLIDKAMVKVCTVAHGLVTVVLLVIPIFV